MDQNNNNSQNEFLWTLLANPADDAQQYNYNLQRLVNDFPQSGILQALLAHTSDEKNLKQASVYFNAKALYKLINAPASLVGVAGEKIIVQNGTRPLNYNGYQQQDTNTGNAENYFSDHTAVETLTGADELPATENEITHPAIDGHHATESAAEALTAAAEGHNENLIAEAHVPHEHQELNENIADEVHAGSTDGLETAPVEELTHHDSEAPHETFVNDIKDEVVKDIPFAEPIINYASGMGHRLAPDSADGVEPAAEHTDAVQGEAHIPPIHEEYLEAGYPTAETQTEPLPEEQLVTDETVPETHAPATVNEEHAAAEHKDFEAPHVPEQVITDPVAAEDKGFEEPEAAEHLHEEHQHTVYDYAAEHEIEEPVQQYRPWDEPAPQAHHQPEIEEEKAVTADHHQTEVKTDEPAPEAHHQPEIEEEKPAPADQHQTEVKADEPAPEAHRQPEIEEEKPAPVNLNQTEIKADEPAPEAHHQPEAEQAQVNHAIDDEVYDEITGIETDIIGNIAGTDYFMFDRAFGEHKKPGQVSEPGVKAAEPVNESDGDADQQDLSKYHDEKMPYSFLWWLDKTRKEHSGIYQPYTAPEGTNAVNTRARLKAGTDELQQQYYENIFHITSVEDLDKSLPQPPYAAPSPFENNKKEQVIIERFIQEEPQIRPQSSDKLDNENKAKKSSEDRDELVSETLAAIYSDQMLYHKAIASYKKLMLRFPEKSRYFAGKIEQLEKKTN